MRSPETSLLTEAEGAGGFLEAEAEVRAGGARAGRCSSGTHGAVWPRPVFGAAGAAGGAGGGVGGRAEVSTAAAWWGREGQTVG